MLWQFEQLRNEIRHNATETKDYKRVVKLGFKYLAEINKLQNVDTRADREWIHYEIGLNSKKDGDYKTSIKHTLISLNYMENQEGLKYCNRMWLIATIYTNMGNISEAKNIYYKCSSLFRKLGEENQRAMIIFNNAKLSKSFKAMKAIIKIYETKALKTIAKTHGDMEFVDILKSYYLELIELYMCEGMQNEAFQVIYSIDISIEPLKLLKKELLTKLVA
jgi:tetratricopeptide (TPR) repeat protein